MYPETIKKQLKAEKDFIVIARKPIADMTMKETKKSLTHVLKLAKLLR